MNVTEYLEHLCVRRDGEDLAVIQPLHQKRIWERCKPGDGPAKA